MACRFLLFDLDGTLVDSLDDITAAVNASRGRLQLPPLEDDQVRAFVGDGLAPTIERSVPPESARDALRFFMEYYQNHCLDATRPYPGVPQMLAQLRRRGALAAVVTNKARAMAEKILDGLGLSRCLRFVQAPDGAGELKPAPEPFLRALAALGGAAAEALVVGDGRNDVLGARAAGLAVCGVLYGMGRPEEIRGLRPDFLVRSPAEIVELLG
jgi:phosphoglycolate phosphatase